MRQIRRRMARRSAGRMTTRQIVFLAVVSFVLSYWVVLRPVSTLIGRETLNITPITVSLQAADQPICVESIRSLCIRSERSTAHRCIVDADNGERFLADEGVCPQLEAKLSRRVIVSGLGVPPTLRRIEAVAE